MKIESRPTRITIGPHPVNVLDDAAIHVEVTDEGAGEYITMKCNDGNSISFDGEMWPAIRDAVEQMWKGLRG